MGEATLFPLIQELHLMDVSGQAALRSYSYTQASSTRDWENIWKERISCWKPLQQCFIRSDEYSLQSSFSAALLTKLCVKSAAPLLHFISLWAAETQQFSSSIIWLYKASVKLLKVGPLLMPRAEGISWTSSGISKNLWGWLLHNVHGFQVLEGLGQT